MRPAGFEIQGVPLKVREGKADIKAIRTQIVPLGRITGS